MALPKFLIKKTPKLENIRKIRSILKDDLVHTVCESAKCPNIGECYKNNSLTFMILGDVCSRHCRFCGVSKGKLSLPDEKEPERIVLAVKKLKLDYVVITSVTRDDLEDGGSAHFAKVINALKNVQPELKIEVLIPDFQGNQSDLERVLAANPYVLNHNVETIPRLYSKIRPEADYQRSLKLLQRAKNRKNNIYIKSGFMVGLGERREEVFSLLLDLKEVGTDIVTIGQYLPPSRDHLRTDRYVDPEEFEEYKRYGEQFGLKVFSGPFVRSSYHAKEVVKWKKHKDY
jgi:lipoyl synthase